MSVRIKHHPHNDLMALAHHHVTTIREKIEAGRQDGIKLDCMSALIAMAFAVEALINYVGAEKIPAWNERSSYPDKLRILRRKINLSTEASAQPWLTLTTLKQVRNQLAHGKPMRSTARVTTKEELNEAMASPWDQHCTPETVEEAFANVREFRRLLLAAAQISLGASFTSAAGGFDPA
ncbi:hypothetical protein [Burkholderia sp. Ac-20365]|uniref:hypothetical protein n=1 Tax=Burkholderia sp. Ac-20365 TaxID=2703897 RepID=UPI00197B5E4F|nr:hypothetical protein [Burkholderia sp. Ac-20365]MBN3761042.1 hypothetical protein [Burkholderia sp. Ac-20365]